MPFVSHVVLTLFGNRYEVLRFRYGFHRVTDTKGRLVTSVRGGEIIVDVESTSDVSAHENIFEYGFPRSVPGSLEVWNRDEMHCFRRIEWSEAYIFEVGEAMAWTSWEPMTMRLAITPLRLDFDRTEKIDRRWMETYGIWWEKYQPKEKAEPYVRLEKGISNKPECTVSFRRTKDYDGSFGFDKLRTGDTDEVGCEWYKKIMTSVEQFDLFVREY